MVQPANNRTAATVACLLRASWPALVWTEKLEMGCRTCFGKCKDAPSPCGTGRDHKPIAGPRWTAASSAALNPQTAQAKQRTPTPESEGTGEKCLGSARSRDGTAAAGTAQCFLLTQVRHDSVILPVLSSLSLKTSSVVRLNYFGSSNSLINKLFDCDIPQKLQTHRTYSRDKQHTQPCWPCTHTQLRLGCSSCLCWYTSTRFWGIPASMTGEKIIMTLPRTF